MNNATTEQNIKYVSNTQNFFKIPGNPIAYWVSESIYNTFLQKDEFCGETRKGILTGDNNTYLRLWFEVAQDNLAKDVFSHEEMVKSKYKWFLVTSGGEFRKWYGNIDTVVNLQEDGRDIKNNVKNYRLRESKYYFREAIAWTEVCSSTFSCRYVPKGILFGNGGPSCFFYNDRLEYVLGLLNSNVVMGMMSYLAPTLNYGPDQISKVPVIIHDEQSVKNLVRDNIKISGNEWDSYEVSVDFKKHPLI